MCVTESDYLMAAVLRCIMVYAHGWKPNKTVTKTQNCSFYQVCSIEPVTLFAGLCWYMLYCDVAAYCRKWNPVCLVLFCRSRNSR